MVAHQQSSEHSRTHLPYRICTQQTPSWRRRLHIPSIPTMSMNNPPSHPGGRRAYKPGGTGCQTLKCTDKAMLRRTGANAAPAHGKAARAADDEWRDRTPHRRFARGYSAAFATGSAPITKPPSPTPTCTVWPSTMRPCRICSASGFCSARWMTRFSGRAP